MGTHDTHPPSGLFPAGPRRPRYREPHPVRATGVLLGLAAGSLWFLLFGLLGTTPAGYGWWTLAAGVTAWAAVTVLARYGDRGVAVGVALATAAGWSVAATAVVLIWTVTGDWPLW